MISRQQIRQQKRNNRTLKIHDGEKFVEISHEEYNKSLLHVCQTREKIKEFDKQHKNDTEKDRQSAFLEFMKENNLLTQ